MNLKFKKLQPDAFTPQYASEGAACFDLNATLDGPVNLTEASQAVVIPTHLSFEIPEDHVMLVFSRSGHGFKNGVRLANCVGVIDSDYRGEVMVKLAKDTTGSLVINHGDRIAQALVLPVQRVHLVEASELSETARGEKGLGSTGTNANVVMHQSV